MHVQDSKREMSKAAAAHPVDEIALTADELCKHQAS